MNYQRIYDQLIHRARIRTIADGVYVERHHIIPRCLGGNSHQENIAILTPEEHYVAHQLLVKMYPGHKGLVFAAHLMTTGKDGMRNTNKLYGWLRRRMSDAMKGSSVPSEVRQKISRTLRNNPETIARARRLGRLRRGKRGPNAGKVFSAETRAKMSARKRGIPKSAQHKLNISCAQKARWERRRTQNYV